MKYLAVILITTIAIIGCPGNNTSNTPNTPNTPNETRTPYTCANGTPASGGASGDASVEKCQSCNNGYILSNGSCVMDDTSSTQVPSKDFDTLRVTTDNDDPQGIWSDGTTMWVADGSDEKVYAYSVSTKARDAAKDFNTLSAASNNDPYSLWSDGTTMWVTDPTDDKIYAYIAPNVYS